MPSGPCREPVRRPSVPGGVVPDSSVALGRIRFNGGRLRWGVGSPGRVAAFGDNGGHLRVGAVVPGTGRGAPGMHSSTIGPIRRGPAVLRMHGTHHTARPAQMRSIVVLCRFARRIDPRGARHTPLQMPAVKNPIRPTTTEEISDPRGRFPTRDMHDAPIGARRRSRGLSRMPHMPDRPRPTGIASNGASRMLRAPATRPHPSPGASRRTQSAGDTDARGNDCYGRRARTPCGTGPMDAAAGGPHTRKIPGIALIAGSAYPNVQRPPWFAGPEDIEAPAGEEHTGCANWRRQALPWGVVKDKEIQLPLEAPSWLNSGDTSWQITAATLVGLMSVPGLAVLYGGVMQKRWSINSMMLTFGTFSVVLLVGCCGRSRWASAHHSTAFRTPASSGTSSGNPGRCSRTPRCSTRPTSR